MDGPAVFLCEPMKRYRNLISYLLIIFCLLTSTLVWAGESLRIEIHGVTDNALKNTQARLEVIAESYGKELTPADIQDFYKNAPENIRKALEPFGYFNAKVQSKLIDKTAVFDITPGRSIKISSIDLSLTGPGKDDSKLKKIITHFPLKAGDALSTERYDKAKEDFFQIANNQGYLKATLDKKEIRINRKTYTAQIILHFNTGPRYYFGHVHFAKSRFAPNFLQRFVSFHENEPYSGEALSKFQQNLRNSHYFQQVEATPDFDQATDYRVPINVQVGAPKSQRYDAGIGYGTFTGLRFTGGADFRQVNDSGQHFNTQFKLSSVLSGFAAKYFIPGTNPLTDQYTVGANIQYFAPQNGTSFSQTLSGSYVKSSEEWQRTMSVNYLNERYRIEAQPTHRSQVFYPSLSVSRIKADNIISPRFGSMMNFTIQGASKNVLSKTNFFQSEAKGKYIYSPTSDSRVIVRGDIGYTVVQNLQSLPMTLNFFGGGLGSVRGYPYSSIGPGKYLEVASVEVQHKIIGKWSGAIFYDIGNVSDTFNGNFLRGDGLGIIYNSPFGPVQLYVARGLSKRNKPLSVEFSMGPEF